MLYYMLCWKSSVKYSTFQSTCCYHPSWFPSYTYIRWIGHNVKLLVGYCYKQQMLHPWKAFILETDSRLAGLKSEHLMFTTARQRTLFWTGSGQPKSLRPVYVQSILISATNLQLGFRSDPAYNRQITLFCRILTIVYDIWTHWFFSHV
jgi:hypothetical protein